MPSDLFPIIRFFQNTRGTKWANRKGAKQLLSTPAPVVSNHKLPDHITLSVVLNSEESKGGREGKKGKERKKASQLRVLITY